VLLQDSIKVKDKLNELSQEFSEFDLKV